MKLLFSFLNSLRYFKAIFFCLFVFLTKACGKARARQPKTEQGNATQQKNQTECLSNQADLLDFFKK